MAAGPTAIPKFRCPPLRINPAFRIVKPSNFISKGTSYFEIPIYGLVERRYDDLDHDHDHDYSVESGSSQDYKVRTYLCLPDRKMVKISRLRTK